MILYSRKQLLMVDCMRCVCVCCRAEELPSDFYKVSYNMESAVKRKTLLKNGKKPSVSICSVCVSDSHVHLIDCLY